MHGAYFLSHATASELFFFNFLIAKYLLSHATPIEFFFSSLLPPPCVLQVRFGVLRDVSADRSRTQQQRGEASGNVVLYSIPDGTF